MDIRIEIVREIKQALQELNVADDVCGIVSDVLIMRLNDYEVQERCTAVATVDDSPERMLKKFIATKRIEGKSEATLQRYAEACLNLIRFVRKPLQEVTTYDIRFYLAVKRQQDHNSNRTLDGLRRVFSSFFGWLSAEGMIGRNPCASISQIKYKKEVKKPFSAVDLEKIQTACVTVRDRALVEFLYSTGCRVSEVSGLDIADIDFDKAECVVTGKGNKERMVYLSPVAMMYLKRYLNQRDDISNALFIGKGCKRLSKGGIEAVVKRIGISAGVENVHPHRFRRTLATNLLDRGMNIQDVAKILGHADLKTTQIYCFISQNNVKSAYLRYCA